MCSMEHGIFHEVPWNSMEFHRIIQWNSMEQSFFKSYITFFLFVRETKNWYVFQANDTIDSPK